MGEIPIPVTEAQIYGHPISPHISHYAQTLRDQSDASRVAQIERMQLPRNGLCQSKKKTMT